MIKAVLFDMDDTLLDIDLGAFIVEYLAGKSRILGRAARRPAIALGLPFAQSYLAVSSSRRTDSLTNEQVFNERFLATSGIPLDDPAIVEAVTFYEREILPHHNTRAIHARPRPGGLAAIGCAEKLGLTVALATNPSFSEACVRCRMGWAGVADYPFARISHMGNSTRLKPNAGYYQEFVSALGLAPEECLMVGNDRSRDFPKPDIGLATLFVGRGPVRSAAWAGDMSALAEALPAIVDYANGIRG